MKRKKSGKDQIESKDLRFNHFNTGHCTDHDYQQPLLQVALDNSYSLDLCIRMLEHFYGCE
jgi:hypothetical protein